MDNYDIEYEDNLQLREWLTEVKIYNNDKKQW